MCKASQTNSALEILNTGCRRIGCLGGRRASSRRNSRPRVNAAGPYAKSRLSPPGVAGRAGPESSASRPSSAAIRGRVLAREERGDFGDGVATGEPAPADGRKAIGRAGEAQLLKDFAGGRRQERPEQNRQDAADFGQVVKHLVQPPRLAWVFGQFERGRLIDVLIGAIDQAPDGFERGLQLMFLK